MKTAKKVYRFTRAGMRKMHDTTDFSVVPSLERGFERGKGTSEEASKLLKKKENEYKHEVKVNHMLIALSRAAKNFAAEMRTTLDSEMFWKDLKYALDSDVYDGIIMSPVKVIKKARDVRIEKGIVGLRDSYNALCDAIVEFENDGYKIPDHLENVRLIRQTVALIDTLLSGRKKINTAGIKVDGGSFLETEWKVRSTNMDVRRLHDYSIELSGRVHMEELSGCIDGVPGEIVITSLKEDPADDNCIGTASSDNQDYNIESRHIANFGEYEYSNKLKKAFKGNHNYIPVIDEPYSRFTLLNLNKSHDRIIAPIKDALQPKPCTLNSKLMSLYKDDFNSYTGGFGECGVEQYLKKSYCKKGDSVEHISIDRPMAGYDVEVNREGCKMAFEVKSTCKHNAVSYFDISSGEVETLTGFKNDGFVVFVKINDVRTFGVVVGMLMDPIPNINKLTPIKYRAYWM